MLVRAAEKEFLFDGTRRYVNLQTRATEGRRISITLPLKNTSNGDHSVAFGFNANGARLEVDGEKFEQYGEEAAQ